MSRIDDGHSTTITLSGAPSIKFWEKEVTPPGIDGGGPNDTTTMRNLQLRTRSPKKLKTFTAFSATVSYDPAAYEDVMAQCNINQLITITFPDGSKLDIWGWLNEFTPGACVEGEQPTAEATFEPSNQNASGVETLPVYTPPP